MGSVVFSASYQISYYGYYTQYVRVSFSESYDAAQNRSAVTLTGVEMASEYAAGSCPVYGEVKINGTSVLTMSGGSHQVNLGRSYGAVSYSGGGTVYVPHDGAGAASVTVTLAGGSGGYFGAMVSESGKPTRMFGVPVPTSQSAALTTRPRASAIAACPAAAETLSTVTLSMERHASAYFHRARFLAGDTVLAESEPFAASLSYTVPRSWFSAYPNDASLALTVSVQTYTDRSCATAVGAPATAEMTVTADADMKPAVAGGWVSLAPYNTGAVASIAGYVRGYSRAEASFDASKIDMSAAVGASVASYTLACQGESVGAAPYRTGVLASGAPSVRCTVTDSRGRSASESFTLAVMDYAAPSLSAIGIFRCGADMAADEEGLYIRVGASLSFSPLEGQNAAALTAAVAASGGSYGPETALADGAAARLGPVSADLSYGVRLTATDALGNTARYFATVPTRRWAMKFRPDGRGVAFGKAAEHADCFEIAADWAVKSQGVVDLVYPVGSLWMTAGAAADPNALFGGTWARRGDAPSASLYLWERTG